MFLYAYTFTARSEIHLVISTYRDLALAEGELWTGTKWAASEVWSGAEWAGVEIASGVKWSLGEIRGGAVWIADKVYDAYKYLRTLFGKILHAASWDVLKAIAEPILGPSFMQAGVLWGIIESLGKNIWSLLELGKMVVLAGCYELMIHPDVATTLALNPTTMPMVLTALALKAVAHEIPDLAAQMKKSDDQLKKMVTDLWKVVSNWDEFVGFVKALGKQIKLGDPDASVQYLKAETLITKDGSAIKGINVSEFDMTPTGSH